MRTNKIQNSLSVSHPQMSGKEQYATNHIALCNVRGTAVDRVEWSVIGGWRNWRGVAGSEKWWMVP